MAVLVISGPSGVGKNTLIQCLVARYNLRFEVPYTSRCARASEVNGREYNFLSQTAFQDEIVAGSFVEWDFTLGSYYGFVPGLLDESRGPVVTHSLARMALRIRSRFPQVKLLCLLAKDREQVRTRLSVRHAGPDEVSARIAHGDEEMIHSRLFDLTIQIEGGEDAVEKCFPILQGLGLAPPV